MVLKGKNYHKRLEIPELFNLERRRERFLIINVWQQIEGKKENVLKLETRVVRRWQCLKSLTIPMALDVKYSMIIQCATVRRMERLFNVISYDLQNMKNVSTHTFKRHIDIWLRSIPDAPKIMAMVRQFRQSQTALLIKLQARGDPFVGSHDSIDGV